MFLNNTSCAINKELLSEFGFNSSSRCPPYRVRYSLFEAFGSRGATRRGHLEHRLAKSDAASVRRRTARAGPEGVLRALRCLHAVPP